MYRGLLVVLAPGVKISSLHSTECTWAAKEGPIELLLAKVKNASDRIGIFSLGRTDRKQSIRAHRAICTGRLKNG